MILKKAKYFFLKIVINPFSGPQSVRLTESGHAAPGVASGLIPHAQVPDQQTHSSGQTGQPATPQVTKHANSKASKPKLIWYLQIGLPLSRQLLAVLQDSFFTDGENFN